MKKITRSDGTLRMLLRMTWKLYRRQMILTLVVTLLGQTAEFLTGTYMLGFTVNALREQRPVSGIFSFLLLASLVTVAADTVRMLYVRRIKRVLDLRSSVKLGRMLHERALHTDLRHTNRPRCMRSTAEQSRAASVRSRKRRMHYLISSARSTPPCFR